MARNKQMMSYRQDNEQETRSSRRPVVTNSTPPTYEAIQARAYEIFLARGSKPGTAADDWLQAEHELAVDDDSVDD